MAKMAKMALFVPKAKFLYNSVFHCQERMIQTTSVYAKAQSGKYKATLRKDKPLTYEMANAPHQIGVRKAWNSWNTSTIQDGIRIGETAVEEMFIRKFVVNTFSTLILSEVIIKRQFNMIRVAAICQIKMPEEKMAFLMGYCQELLSYWLQSPVKLEFQTTKDPKALIYKYI